MNNSYDYVYHHGIKGMKWGIRRFQRKDGSLTSAGKNRYSGGSFIQGRKKKEQDIQRKLEAIKKTQGGKLNSIDKKRFEYRKDPYIRRLTKQTTGVAISMIMGDIITGKASRYTKMSKTELAVKVGKIIGTGVAKTTLNDKLAESAMKRYSDNGRRKGKDPLINKETLVEIGVSTALKAAPAIGVLAGLKLSQVAAKNKANRERFEAWGGNILNEKVDNVVWQSDDLKTAIIDNRRR